MEAIGQNTTSAYATRLRIGMPANAGIRMRSRVADALVVFWPIATMVSALLSFAPRVPGAHAQRNSSLVTAGGKSGGVL